MTSSSSARLGKSTSSTFYMSSKNCETQVVCQFGEVHFWHDPGSISGIHYWWKGGACGSNQDPSHSGLASPNHYKELRSFLGLANFYRRFVLGFSHITWPLSQVTKGGVRAKLFWSEPQQKVFTELKNRLCSAPVLTLPDLQQPFEIETNSFDYAIGVVLTQ